MSNHLVESNRLNPVGHGTVSSVAMHSIVTWCEALYGAVSLQVALSSLVAGLCAEAAVIVRTSMKDLRPVRIATCDPASDSRRVRPLTRSFADAFFGTSILRPQPATIWLATAHGDDATGDPSLAEWQADRHMKEFAVLILSTGVNTRDHIELHFRNPLSKDTETTVALMLPDMVRVWTMRKAGLIAQTIINHRSAEQPDFCDARHLNILGVDNPLQLSRAEFRVCLLLSRGLMIQAAGKELSLSEPTIRTHLRNIYGKTHCSSLAELVFRLMEGQKTRPISEARSA